MNIHDRNLIICITGDIDYFDTETDDCLFTYFSILKRYDIIATFFITAQAAERKPEGVNSILEHGHEVEGHGDVHEAFYGTIPEQVNRLELMNRTFRNLFDIDIKGFRAPWYQHNANTSVALQQAGLQYDCSKKRFEVAFKKIPYFSKAYIYTPFYPIAKPALRYIASIYNYYHKIQRSPYYIQPNILEIPTLGISDYSLIDDPNGPRYSPLEAQKIGEIWIECFSAFRNSGGGVLNIQAHPGRLSPRYIQGLDYFISNAIKSGAKFSTLAEICNIYG
jgi:peptidoglycan/xylan/chitin deacetylase (PgdA/CDA1 family)